MQEIINGIQLGEFSPKQLIEVLLEYEDRSVNEYNSALDMIETMENTTTMLGLQLSSANKRADEAEQALAEVESGIETLKANSQKIINNSNAQQAELIRTRETNKTSKAHAKENKALKANKAKQMKAAIEREKRITRLETEKKELQATVNLQDTTIARLRMTGEKTIGDFKFTIFPSHITATDKGVVSKRLGLVAYKEDGNMRVVRAGDDGTIIQPKGNEFEFCKECISFIQDYSALAKAEGEVFTNKILRMVN